MESHSIDLRIVSYIHTSLRYKLIIKSYSLQFLCVLDIHNTSRNPEVKIFKSLSYASDQLTYLSFPLLNGLDDPPFSFLTAKNNITTRVSNELLSKYTVSSPSNKDVINNNII